MKRFGQEVEIDAERTVLDCLEDVPFLKVLGTESRTERSEVRPDALLTLRTPHGDRLLVIETKRNGEPRLVREGVNQILRCLAHLPNAYGVLVAPYISPRSAEICSQEGIGYVDFAGNCRLTFDGVYIRREGRRNPVAEKRDLRSLYSPRASRVLRVLLSSPGRTWTLQDLAAEAQVSIGQAYNVKKLLVDREWLRASDKGVLLTSSEQLLLEWADNYAPRRTRVLSFYSLKSVNDVEYDLAEACGAAGTRYALTALSGAARYAAFVRYQRATAYVDDVTDDLVGSLQLKPVASGANVSLLVPYDEGVYYGSRDFSGARVVSPVQVYLDLRGTHGRSEEAAGKLLEEVIRPRWRQAG